MSMLIKVKISGININIKETYDNWWLDFYYNKKRIKRSTFLT